MRLALFSAENLRVEIEPDLRGLFNRLPVELGWFELILQNGFKCRVLEDLRATDELGVGHFAIFAYLHLNNDRTAHPAGLGNCRVLRGHGPGQLQGFELRLLKRGR